MTKANQSDRISELWATAFPEGTLPPEGVPELSKLHALVTISVFRASKELERRMDAFLRCFNLTQARMAVLLQLAFAESRMTPSVLGDRLSVTRATMTGLVEGLVQEDLVVRVPRDGDRRVHDLELTERGRKFVANYIPHHVEALRHLTAGLTVDEAKKLAELLHKFHTGMQPLEPLEAPALFRQSPVGQEVHDIPNKVSGLLDRDPVATAPKDD